MSQMTRSQVALLVALRARHDGGLVALLVVLVGASCAATLPSYASTYTTAAARTAAVHLADHNPAGTVLYGVLDPPGSAAQMFVWEMGAFLTILVAVAAVLLAVRATRGAESDGSLALVRSAGVPPAAPTVAAMVFLGGTAALLGVAATVGLAVHAGRDGVTVVGSLAWGAVVGVTFALVAALAASAAQVVATVPAARTFGLVIVALSFAARARADTGDGSWRWLGALSPLGLRGVVKPCEVDDFRPVAIALGIAVLIGAGTVVVASRRELGAALLRPTEHRSSRMRVSGVTTLVARLTAGSTLGWLAGVGLLVTFFVGMGGGVVDNARAGRLSSGLLESQVGTTDPVSGYLGYIGTIAANSRRCARCSSCSAMRGLSAAGRSRCCAPRGSGDGAFSWPTLPSPSGPRASCSSHREVPRRWSRRTSWAVPPVNPVRMSPVSPCDRSWASGRASSPWSESWPWPSGWGHGGWVWPGPPSVRARPSSCSGRCSAHPGGSSTSPPSGIPRPRAFPSVRASCCWSA